MSDQVHLPDAAFEHARLHLAPPNGLQGGAYFAMLYYKDAPLYIQTPKCTSRQAVVPGKRPYIDLMFSSHDVSFLEWLETLETDAIRLIYEKRNLWFNGADLEKSDIEAGFTSPVRPYKGGKHYLIRAHIQPAKHLAGTQSCSIFDENERPVSVDHIKAEHQMYTVLEFMGIKFTSRSFQLEVALKQVLLVSNVPIFQSCVIRKPSASTATTATMVLDNNSQQMQKPDSVQDSKPDSVQDSVQDPVQYSKPDSVPDSKPDSVPDSKPDSVQDSKPDSVQDSKPDSVQEQDPEQMQTSNGSNESNESNDAIGPNANANANANAMQLQEVNLDVLEELEHMHLKLKKPTEVYYNLYRIAKQKAKELKKNAIAAHLEAKQIKSAHMLEDSESDSDNSVFSYN